MEKTYRARNSLLGFTYAIVLVVGKKSQQKRVIMPKIITDGEREQNERIRENMLDAEAEYGDITLMPYRAFEEMFEDRDPFEFL